MQSVTAAACKALRVFYAILTKGVDYGPEKLLGDIRRPQTQAEVMRCHGRAELSAGRKLRAEPSRDRKAGRYGKTSAGRRRAGSHAGQVSKT
jgi:hypothetical protein